MVTTESAKAKALEITARFPEAKTVTEAFDLAKLNDMFANETEALAAWGRLSRLLPHVGA